MCRDVVCNYSIAVIKLQILRGYEREHSFSPGPIQPRGKPSGGPRRVLHASMTPLTNSDIVKRRRNPFIFRLLLYSLSTDIAVKRHGPRRLLRFCLSVAEEEKEEEALCPPRKQLRTVNRPVTILSDEIDGLAFVPTVILDWSTFLFRTILEK